MAGTGRGIVSAVRRRQRELSGEVVGRQRLEVRTSVATAQVVDEIAAALGVSQSAFVSVAVAYFAAQVWTAPGIDRTAARARLLSILTEITQNLKP
jgi:uncharacterized protein (DUF1778 family)